MFWCFGHEACGILAPWPGMEPAPPVLEGEVWTTGLPGKSRSHFLYFPNSVQWMLIILILEINNLFLISASIWSPVPCWHPCLPVPRWHQAGIGWAQIRGSSFCVFCGGIRWSFKNQRSQEVAPSKISSSITKLLCKRPASKYFKLCGTFGHWCNYSILP